jgi:hypothetical protein
MDANTHYHRFRACVRALAEDRLQHAPDWARDDWLSRCYQSKLCFEQFFPDPRQREEMISRWEVQADGNTGLGVEIARINREGLSYTDIESLEYEFPGPGAEPPERPGR